MATNNTHMKFEIQIPEQARVTLRKPYHLQSPDTLKSSSHFNSDIAENQ